MKAECKQSGGHKTESQHKHGGAQTGNRNRTETGKEGDAAGIDKPMGKKKENLHNKDGNEWPGFQAIKAGRARASKG